MRIGLVAAAVIVAALLIVAYSSAFILNPTQQALVLEFGQIKRAIKEPGLYFKVPMIQDVRILDKRILDLDVPAQEIIAADQKRLVVDAFARWRIEDPLLFYQSVQTAPVGASRLSTFVQSALRAVLADASFEDIVRDDRPQLMERIRLRVERNAEELGVEVVDVRIRRADLPEANSQAIYARMETERQQEATQIRARGAEAAQRIRAAADRAGVVIRAEANRESEQVRGDGDARRNEIFAAAYNRDPEFFSFYRSMQAYLQGLQPRETSLVIAPTSDFFRFFNNPTGTMPASRDRALVGTGDATREPASAPTPQPGATLPGPAGPATADTPPSGASGSEAAAARPGTAGTEADDAWPFDGGASGSATDAEAEAAEADEAEAATGMQEDTGAGDASAAGTSGTSTTGSAEPSDAAGEPDAAEAAPAEDDLTEAQPNGDAAAAAATPPANVTIVPPGESAPSDDDPAATGDRSGLSPQSGSAIRSASVAPIMLRWGADTEAVRTGRRPAAADVGPVGHTADSPQ